MENKKKKTRISFEKCSLPKLTMIIGLVIFVIYGLSLVFPLIWAGLNSFRANKDFKRYPLDWFNFRKWSLDNYNILFTKEYNIFSMIINSFLIAAAGTLITCIMCAMSAYVVSKYRFKGQNFIYSLAITVMLIPTSGSLAAQYRFMVDSQLIDTFFGVIILNTGGFGFNFFLLYGTFKSVSWAYAEAGKMDGASNLVIFWRIMLPQVVPALFAVGIITFINLWNDYFTPFMYLKNHQTLAVGIYRLQRKFESLGGNWPVVFSAMVLSSVPIIVVFSIFQKTIIANTVAGGLKG